MTELNLLAVQNADVLRALTDTWVSAKSLAAELGRDQSNLGKTLKSLEAAGLVRAAPLENGLTDEGQAQLAAIRRAETDFVSGAEAAETLPDGLLTLRHDQILPDPDNARTDWTSEEARWELDALRMDIVQNGLLQNLVVRLSDPFEPGATVTTSDDPVEGYETTRRTYVLVAGERRWRAIGEAIQDGDWEPDAPIIVRLLDTDARETRFAAIAENLLRRKLNPIEKANGFEQLAALGFENKLIAERLGYTPEHVQQHRRFLKLDEADQQRMTLSRDDPRHLSVRDARQKLAAKDNAPEPITLDPMARLAWIELTHAAYNEGRYSNLWNEVLVAPGAAQTSEAQRLAEVGAVEFSDLKTWGENLGRFTAKRHYDANRTAERLMPPFPADIMASTDKPKQDAALRAAQVDALGDAAPEWPENDVAYATPWLADIGDVTPEGEALREQRARDDAARERENEARAERIQARERIWAEARQRHLRLMAVAQERPEAGQPAEIAEIATDLERPLPWRVLPSGAIVAANGATVQPRLYGAPPSDLELALGQMIVVAANAAAGVVTPPMEEPEPEPDEDAFLAAIGTEVSARQPELDAEAHSALTAAILQDFLEDNGVAFGEDGFDWTDEGATALAIAHYEAAQDEAREAEEVAGPIRHEPGNPAVAIADSVDPDFIVCLEDGRKFKSLKRHLRTKYDLSPEAYRERWDLPADYPMVAANYQAARDALARQMGASVEPSTEDDNHDEAA